MARATKPTRGRQPPPNKPPTKRRRRGTKINGSQPSAAELSDGANRVQTDNTTEEGHPNSMQQRNTTRSPNAVPESNGMGERCSNDRTPEGGFVHMPSSVVLEAVQRAPSTTTGRQSVFAAEPTAPGVEDNCSLPPETPATKTPHGRLAGLVSSDAETEENDDPELPPESEARSGINLRLIHKAFPQRGGSVDRAGIEGIRRLARSNRIPDSIPPGLADSQDIPTIGVGHYVPFMNTPQMTSEPVEAVDLEATLSNQGHQSAWESFSEEQLEPPFGCRHLFRNRIGEREFGLGLLDNDISCPTVEAEIEHLQPPSTNTCMGSPPTMPVRIPSDTQDLRSRQPSNIDTTLTSEDFEEPTQHRPVIVTTNCNASPTVDQTNTALTSAIGDLPQTPDLQNTTTNVAASARSPNEAPRNAPPHQSVRQRAARHNGCGAHNRRCNDTADIWPTPVEDPTPSIPTDAVVQTRQVDPQPTARTPRIPPVAGATMAEPGSAAATFPSRTRQALSPGRLASVRNLDKVPKRLQHAWRKQAGQLATTGGTGAVSLVTKQILDLCAGEPQGESHKDLVGALARIVPTELPCYREIKSVTRHEIEAICKRTGEVFSNAQDVLPTWTRKIIGRLLKSRRTRTRRKVKRLMAARASVQRGQPSPPVPPGVFLVEVDHFVLELLTKEFQNVSKRMTDRSNKMVKAKGCGNKAGAGGYERAKAHIAKREGRPATLRELHKWKVATKRQYDVGPSRTAASRRLAGVTTSGADAEVQSTDGGGSSASASSPSSSDADDFDGTCSSDGTLEAGGTTALDGLANCNGETDFDSSADDGTAGALQGGGSRASVWFGCDAGTLASPDSWSWSFLRSICGVAWDGAR